MLASTGTTVESFIIRASSIQSFPTVPNDSSALKGFSSFWCINANLIIRDPPLVQKWRLHRTGRELHTGRSTWIHFNEFNEPKVCVIYKTSIWLVKLHRWLCELFSVFQPNLTSFCVSVAVSKAHSNEIPSRRNMQFVEEEQALNKQCTLCSFSSLFVLVWCNTLKVFRILPFVMIKKDFFTLFLTFVLLLAYLSQFSQLSSWWGDKCFDKHTLERGGGTVCLFNLLKCQRNVFCSTFSDFILAASERMKKKHTKQQTQQKAVWIRESLLFDSL